MSRVVDKEQDREQGHRFEFEVRVFRNLLWLVFVVSLLIVMGCILSLFQRGTTEGVGSPACICFTLALIGLGISYQLDR